MSFALLIRGQLRRALLSSVATLSLVLSMLVFQPEAEGAGAWAVPNISSNNLLINLDGNNTSSLPSSITSGTSRWTSVAPGSSNASGTITSLTRYNSGGIGGLTSSGSGPSVANFGTGVGGVNAAVGGMTVEAWINPGNLRVSSGNWNIIATRWFSDTTGTQPSDKDWHLALYGNGSTARIRLDTNANTSSGGKLGTLTFPATSANKWYLVGFTITSAGVGQIYVNGVADGSASSVGTPGNSANAQLWVGDGRTGTMPMPGTTSKFRIYSTALTATEMQSNFLSESSQYGYPVVTFKANDGAGTADTYQQVGYNTSTALTANSFNRSGYTFTGWNTAANGSGTSYANSANIQTTVATDLYAQWTLDAVTPTVSGTTQVGETLTATPGLSSASGVTSRYQWQNSADGTTWTNISSATQTTYTLTDSDAGLYMRALQILSDGTLSSAAGPSASTSMVLSTNTLSGGIGTSSDVGSLFTVPAGSTIYNVTLTSSNLTGQFSLGTTTGLTWVEGYSTTSSYMPSSISGTGSIFTFRGTGDAINTALASLRYTSATVSTDALKIAYAVGSSTATDSKNYIPIFDNGKLTYHYYVFNQGTGNAGYVSTQSAVNGYGNTTGGITSPNSWYMVTPRYAVENTRALAMITADPNVWTSGIATSAPTWTWPAGTDGYTSPVTFSSGSTSQNGMFTYWGTNQPNVSSGVGYMGFWQNGWATGISTNVYATSILAETYASSPISSTTSTQTFRAVSLPGAPTNLTATPDNKTSVSLSWTAPVSTGTDAISDYAIEYSTDQSTWSTWPHTASTSTSATLSGLSPDTNYWFRVAAVTSVTGEYAGPISNIQSDPGTTTNLTGYSVPANTTGTIRVLLVSSNPAGMLKLGSTSTLSGGIRNTANYPGDTGYTPYNGWTGVASLGSAGRMIGLVATSASNMNTALASLSYTSATASTDTIKMFVSNGSEYVPIVNGSDVEFHYYGYTSTGTTWTGAYGTSGNGNLGNAGASRTINGVTLPTGTSYLATARYRAEDLYLKSLGTYTGWLAASDSSASPVNSSEGSWRWMGPDVNGNTGVRFWSGNQTTGTSVNGEYQDWVASSATSRSEPNGSTNENCLGYNGGGSYNTAPTSGYGWNDFNCGSSYGYFWETFSTNAPLGANTTNPAAANYAPTAAAQTITVVSPAAAPTNLTVTSGTAGQVDLSWSAPNVAGITSYSVQYSTDGVTWTQTRGSDSTVTTQSISGLVTGTYYHFRVAAMVSTGTGYYATTYFTPTGNDSTNAVISSPTTLTDLALDSSLASRYVRVVLRTTNSDSTISIGTPGTTGGVRGTDNYTTRSASGRMIGLTGLGSEVNTALQTLSYTGPASQSIDSIQMWISAGTTSAYPQDFVPVVNAQGQVDFHYFGYTGTSGNWQQAVAAALINTTQINGQSSPGKFLATAESVHQNALVKDAAGSNSIWLNGADSTMVNSQNADGAWFWLGPDTGVTQFYNGNQSSGASGSVAGSFIAWGASSSAQTEPNGDVRENCLTSSGATYAQTNTTIKASTDALVGGLTWNDAGCDATTAGYVWEYVTNTPVGASSIGDNYSGATALSVVVLNAADEPGSVTFTGSGTTTAVVGWSAPTVNAASGITGYVVSYSTNSDMSSAASITTTDTTTWKLLTGLTANTTYYVQVKAIGSSWTGDVSSVTSGSTKSAATTLTVSSSASSNVETTGGAVALSGSNTSGNISVSDLETLLSAGNVILAADTVTISDDVSWSANSTLTIGNATNSTVDINADLVATGASAGLIISSASCVTNTSTGLTSETGCYSLDVKSGAHIVLSGASSSLSIGGVAYVLVRSESDIASHSSAGHSAFNYALANPIVMSTTYSVAPFNFTYSGTFEGLGNTINSLKIIPGSSSHFGLFKEFGGATVRNLGVTNVNISSPQNYSLRVGALVGNGSTTSATNTLFNVWSTGFLTFTGTTGCQEIGGLVGGAQSGTLKISRSWSSVAITTNTNCVGSGGIIGTNAKNYLDTTPGTGNTLVIDEAYSTGNILRNMTGKVWYGNAGIIGVAYGASQTLRNVFSWGNVNSTINGAVDGISTAGISGVGSATIINAYTTWGSIGGSSVTNGLANQTAGAPVSGFSTGLWSTTNGASLVNLAPPTKALYVKVVAPTDGSYDTLSYQIVDSTGVAQTLSSLNLSVSGTPTYSIASNVVKGTYNVSYVSGLTLGGSSAGVYSLGAWIDTTSVTISKYSQVVSWTPTTALDFGSGTTTPSSLATASGGTSITYSVTSAGTTGCSVNSTTAGLAYTGAGTCQVTATAAAAGDYLSATRTVSFVIGQPVTSITIVSSGGGTVGTDFSFIDGSISGAAGQNISINAADVETELATGSLTLAAPTVTIEAPISWSSDSTLKLGTSTTSTIAIRSTITASGTSAGLNIASTDYELDVKNGAAVRLTGASSTLSIGGNSFNLIRSESDFSSITVGSTERWALAEPISFTGTRTKSPVGVAFTGTFDGLGNTVDSLTFGGVPTSDYIGLFALLNGGATVRNLGVTHFNANITSTSSVGTYFMGALAGAVKNSSNTVTQVWSTGVIQLNGSVSSFRGFAGGGLVGNVFGAATLNLSKSWSSVSLAKGNVSVTNLSLGGLVGSNVQSMGQANTASGGSIIMDEVYATGTISANTGTWWGIGGLLGLSWATGMTLTIRDSFSWSPVISTQYTNWGGVIGNNGGTTPTLVNTYTSRPYCSYTMATASGCTTGVTPGSPIAGLSTGVWSTTSGATLTNLAVPVMPLYVKPTFSGATGSINDLGYIVIDGTGATVNLESLGLSVTGTPTFSPSSMPVSAIAYNVTYESGLTLGGASVSLYSLEPWITPVSIWVSRNVTTLSWSPTTSLSMLDSGSTLASPTTNSDASPSYSVVSAGSTGCSVNASTGALSYTAAGTCQVKLTLAQTSTYTAASQTASFVITTDAPLAPTLSNVYGGTASGQLDVVWDAPNLSTTGGTIASYTLEYSTDNTNWTSVTGLTQTTYSITGLTNDTPYYVRIKAINTESMVGAWGALGIPVKPYWKPINTVAPTGPTSVVGGISASVSDGTWDANGNPISSTTYQWQISTDSGSSWSDISGATSSSYTPLASQAGGVLRVAVTKINAAGSTTEYSSASNTIESGLATAPQTLSGTRGDTQISLSWAAPASTNGGTVSSYTVQYSTNGTSWTTASSTVSASATSYTITGLTNGTAYSVQVFATTAAGDSTSVVTASTITPSTTATNTVLPEITGNPVVARQLSASTGTWTTGGATLTYSYQWQSASSSGGTFSDILGATASTYTPVTADSGTYIRVVVTATNVAGVTTAVSGETTVVQTGLTNAPTSLSGSFSATPNLHITVSWVPPTNLNGSSAITGYSLAYSTSANGAYTLVSDTISANAISYVVTGLNPGTTYYFKVLALTAAGAGSEAVTSTGTLFGGAPANTQAPAISAPFTGVGETVSVDDGTWNDYGLAISGYTYQWQRSSDNVTFTDISGETNSSYTLTADDVDGYVRAVVTATNSVGSTSTPGTAFVATSAIASAPQTVTLTPGDESLALAWSAPAALNGGQLTAYRVEYQVSGESSWTLASDSISPSATSYSITGLTNGTAYVVRISATTTVAGTAAVTSATTPYGLPFSIAPPVVSSARVGFTATATEGDWNANGNALSSLVSYQWQVSSDSGASWTDLSSTTNQQALTVAQLGQQLRVNVRVSNSAGSTTQASVPVTVDVGTPSAPTNLSLTAGSASGQLDLSWSAPDLSSIGGTVDHYVVQYQAHGESSWTTLTSSLAATSTTITGLTNGTGYSVRVLANNGYDGAWATSVEESPYWTPINTVTPQVSGTAAVARVLSTTNGTWTDNGATVTGTTVQWQYFDLDINDWVDIAGETSSMYTVTADYVGTTLRSVITETNAAGTTFAVSADTVPVATGLADAPANLSVSSEDEQLDLSWSAPTGLNGGEISAYLIEIFSGSAWSTVTDSVLGGVTTYTITGLTNGTAYDVRVSAITGAGTGASRATVQSTIPFGAPLNTTLPEISGTAAVARSLSVSDGTWNANGNAITSVNYQWQSKVGATWVDISGATAATYVVDAVNSGRLLRAKVSATNDYTTTTVTSAETLQVTTGLAAAPTHLAVVPGDQSLAVSWDAPTVLNGGVITDYEIQYRTSGGSWVTYAHTAQTATSLTLTGLTNAANYDWQVAAVTAAGVGASTSFTADMSSSTPYGRPLLTAAPALTGSSAVLGTLSTDDGSWDSNGRLITSTTYQWQTSTDGVSGWSDISGATSNSYSPVTADYGQYLRSVVTVTNLAGSTVTQSLASAAIGAGAADAPSQLSVTRGDQSFSVTWNAPTALYGGTITDYTIEYSDDSGATWTAVSHSASTDANIEISGMTEGVDYLVRVRAQTEVDGNWAVLGTAVTAIGAPTVVTSGALSGTPILGQTLSVTDGDWDAHGASISSFRYQWQASADGSTNWTDVAGATTSTLTFTTANVYYRAKIWALNEAGESTAAAISDVSAFTVSTAPNAPGNVSAVAGDGQLSLSWTEPTVLGGAPVSDYTIEYSTDGASWTTVAHSASDATSFTITGLTNGDDYYVRVAAQTSVPGTFGVLSANGTTTVPFGAPINASAPAVTGSTIAFGRTVSAYTGTWLDNGNPLARIEYQWQSSQDSGVSWQDISGAQSGSYVIGEYVGYTLRVVITQYNQAGLSTTVASPATSVVAASLATAPQSIQLVPGDQRIAVSWNPPLSLGGTALQSYTIEYSTDNSQWTTVTRSTPTATSEELTGLTNGDAYYVRVRAVTSLNGQVGFASQPAIPAALPINNSLPSLSGTPRYGELLSVTPGVWNANGSPITSVNYQWQASPDSGATWNDIPGETRSSLTIGLYVGSVLRVKETVVNAVGTTSIVSSATTTVIAATAGAPRNLVATPQDGSVQLTWDIPSALGGADIVNYEVELSEDGATWTSVPRTASAITSHQVTGLANGTAYYLRVRGLNGVNGSWSMLQTPVVPRGLPVNLAVPSTTGAAKYQSTLNAQYGQWDSNGDTISSLRYQWQVKTSNSLMWTNIAAATQSSYVIGNVVGSQLRVAVTATNAAGSSVSFSQPTASVDSIPATAPQLSAPQAGNAQIVLNWSAPTDQGGSAVVGYTVEYSTDQQNWTSISVGAATQTATITGLANGTSYYARVRAETQKPGVWSATSAGVTPIAPPAPAAAPAVAPQNVTVIDSGILRTTVMPLAPTNTQITSLTGPSAVTIQPDGRIELVPTQSVVLLNGQPITAAVTASSTALSVQTESVKLSLTFDEATAPDNTDPGITTSGEVTLAQGQTAQFSGEGFTANSPIVTWIQSDPIKLSEVDSDVNGIATAEFSIPADIEPGHHTIQVNSIDSGGNVVSVIYGVSVATSAGPSEVSAGARGDSQTSVPWWVWPLIAALIAAFWFGYVTGRFSRKPR